MTRPNIAHLIEIDGKWLCGISVFETTVTDIDSDETSRSETAVMNREIIRANVKTINCTPIVDTGELAQIFAVIKKDKFIEATVLFPEIEGNTDGYITAEFYVSEVSKKMVCLEANNAFWEVKYSMIER